jgi:alpha-amylase
MSENHEFIRNGTMIQYFEWYLPDDGSLWKKVSREAAKLADAGITALWLPPAFKGPGGIHDVGYGAYDLYDLGEFNQKGSIPTKYGTRREYTDAIRACHKAGMQVYADIVVDHKIGADGTEEVEAFECAGNNREEELGGEIKIRAYTIFNFLGRHGKYSSFTWDSSCFDGVDYDDYTKKNSVYLLKGHTWQHNVDTENGNFDYLMGADLDFSVPKVIKELTDWGKWYLDTTDIDGFRLDAVKHIDAGIYRDWLPAMRSYAKRELFTVGEYWSNDLNTLRNYICEVNGDMSLFDVPLHFNLQRISLNGEGEDLRRVFDNTLTSVDPTHAVTFVDNHDTEPGQALCSWVGGWFREHAYALILLRQSGYPCVFYGDLYGIPSRNINPMGESLLTLLRLRRDYAYGWQHDYWNDAHCIGWTREKGLAAILSTMGEHTFSMYVGEVFSGSTFVDALGNNDSRIVIHPDGTGDFPVHAGQASVYVPEAEP